MHFLFKRTPFYSYITLFYSLSNHIKSVQTKTFFKRSLLRFLTFALLLQRIRWSLFNSNLKGKYSNFPTLQIKKVLIITVCVCFTRQSGFDWHWGRPSSRAWRATVIYWCGVWCTSHNCFTTDNSFKTFEFQPLYVYLNTTCNK